MKELDSDIPRCNDFYEYTYAKKNIVNLFPHNFEGRAPPPIPLLGRVARPPSDLKSYEELQCAYRQHTLPTIAAAYISDRLCCASTTRNSIETSARRVEPNLPLAQTGNRQSECSRFWIVFTAVRSNEPKLRVRNLLNESDSRKPVEHLDAVLTHQLVAPRCNWAATSRECLTMAFRSGLARHYYSKSN